MSGGQGEGVRRGLEVSTLRFKDGHQFYIVNRREPHSKCMGKETSMLDWGGGRGLCVCVLVAQLCPTLCDTMDCSLPGCSVHGSLQVLGDSIVGPQALY